MDHENEVKSLVFQRLKVVCDQLLTNPTRENIRNLIEEINSVSDDLLTYLSEYVLFPVQFHLLKHNSEKKQPNGTLLELVQCLKLILQKSIIDTFEKFVNLSGLLLRLITNNETQKLNENASEDLKYEVISSVRYLYESLDCNGDLIEKLYNYETKLNIHSQAVYACTQIAKSERLIKLRVEAMECMLAFMRVHGDEYSVRIAVRDEIADHIKWHVAEVTASMFPGIVSSCYSILTYNSIVHRDIYVFGIRMLCRSITLVFEDTEDVGSMDFESQLLQMIMKEKCPKNESKPSRAIRSTNWYSSTAEKLATLVNCLVPLCNHQHRKVRSELVRGVSLVLKKCFRHTDPIRTALLHVLIILSLDDAREVAEESQNHLKNLLEEVTPKSKKVLEDLEESFLTSLSSVCSALNCVDENVLLSQLNLVNGLLKIINLKQIFKSPVYLQELLDVLISLVRFDPATVNTFDEHRIQDLDVNYAHNITSNISWRNMKYLGCVTENAVRRIFKTISQEVDLEFFTCHLLDISESSPGDRKEIIYLINNIILCEELQNNERRVEIVRMVLNVYLDPVYWTVFISEDDIDNLESLSLAIIRNNLLQVCLLTEGIGNMAYCLKTDFRPSLIHCLYLIIERAGCANRFLSLIGITSLQKITSACGYNDITQLITENVDFIMHRANIKLSHLEPQTKVFDVFCVIIAYSHNSSLPVLCDVIESLLARNDIVQDKYTSDFLRVFGLFIRKLRYWFTPLKCEECSLNESDEKLSEVLVSLNEAYLSRQQKKNLLSWSVAAEDDELVSLECIFKKTEYDLCDDADDNDGDDDAADDEIQNKLSLVDEPMPVLENEKKESPPHIKLVVTIAKKILHILPHRNTSNKIIIVEILIDSLIILNEFGEDELLPIVHEIWSPLVNRFEYDKTDALLMRRCFELLCVMATTAKNFIRSRTLKVVQPAINEFLLASAKESRLKDSKSVYRMSQRYKFQYTLLRQLGFLVLQIGFQENEINSVLMAVTPYLSSKQPLPLQTACVRFFDTVESKYRDFVRIYLLSLYTERRILCPGNVIEFRQIELTQPENSLATDYRKNISALLENRITSCWSLNGSC